ncbi:hypothetical protein [Paludisphaera soli]|uniref:hypothetical protein n=1 Tax=Paludisphaera soli TaxID=2712865 RepID=UPI0013E9D6D4|nr:hypothetical protein [Paludisphaera soli]
MRKRLARFLKWAAIACGLLLAACLLASAGLTWITGRRLEARLAALRAAGDPLTIADLAPTPVPPAEDAAVPLARVAAAQGAFQKELTALFPGRGVADLPLGPGEQAKLRALFEAQPEIVPLLRDAASRPGYAPPFDAAATTTEMLKRSFELMSRHREASRILQSRSALLVAEGLPDEALELQIVALRLARLPFREPTMSNYLVGIACTRVAAAGVNDVLQSAPVSEAGRRALDAELALLDDPALVRRAFKNERAYSLTSVNEMSANLFWLTGWMRNDLTALMLDLFDDQIRKLDLPYAQAAATASATGRRWSPFGTLVDLLKPALASTREATERLRAATRSLRVLNAIQSRVPTEAEAPPPLDSLGLPREATVDPFTGRPLLVKKLPSGWLVYSVGKDLVDDGGDLEKDKDVGFGAPREDLPGRP